MHTTGTSSDLQGQARLSKARVHENSEPGLVRLEPGLQSKMHPIDDPI